MSYNSKKTIGSMAAGLLVGLAYVRYALGGSAPASSDIRAWAVLILVFIGIGAGAVIVVQIILHIALTIRISVTERNEGNARRIINATTTEDERDRAISLKSQHAGYTMAGIGFCAALIALALGTPVVIALNILFGVYFLAALVEGSVSIYLFERGMRNG